MSRVLVMAAHPDDELLGVGGTILRHIAEGDEVFVSLYDKCRQPNFDKPAEICRRIGATFVSDIDTIWDRWDFRADIVYTHHVGDLNAHHRTVAERALVIGRFAHTVRTFETVSSTEWGLTPFLPDFYVSIDLTAKLGLLEEFYLDELRIEPHPRSIGSITDLAGWRGSTAGFAYAEAFHTIRDRW